MTRISTIVVALTALVACSESTSGDGGESMGDEAGGSISTIAAGGSVHSGGRVGNPGAGGAATADAGGSKGRLGGGGALAAGGRSEAAGGSAGSQATPADAGAASNCNAGLSGTPCTLGSTCNYEQPSTCTVGNCRCLDGKWACAQSTSSCGMCPVPQQARCGDPCNVAAKGCLCQSGGPNFAGCSCSAGTWQCLGR